MPIVMATVMGTDLKKLYQSHLYNLIAARTFSTLTCGLVFRDQHNRQGSQAVQQAPS
jgi:hypothetical protein